MIIGRHKEADFSTINQALDYLTMNPEKERRLILLEGDYHEHLEIHLDNIELIGLGKVKITDGKYARQLDTQGNEIGTFKTPTVYIDAQNAKFQNIIFENRSGHGEIVGQAVAVFVHADQVEFNNCKFLGYQDTLCIGPLPPKQLSGKDFPQKSERRYFEKYRVSFDHCYIEGTVDYIFGGGTAIFNECEIKSLKRLDAKSEGYVTAASTDQNRPFGFTFYQCIFTCEEGTKNVYLGRPWRQYGYTEMIDCHYDEHILLTGWSDWDQHSPDISGVRYIERFTDTSKIKPFIEQRVDWAVISDNIQSLDEIKQIRFK